MGYKAIRYHKKTGAVLAMTVRDVGWTDDGICGVHVLADGEDWHPNLKAGKPLIFENGAFRDVRITDDVAAIKKARETGAEEEYAERRFVQSRKDLLAHPQGLTRALVRVMARRLGVTPKVLMDEVRAEAGL